MEVDLNDQEILRKEKSLKLRELGIEPFGYKNAELNNLLWATDIKDNFSSFEGKEVKIAGRITAIRGHGKAAFITIRDFSGDIQGYLRFDNLQESYKLFKEFVDIGDYIFLKGTIFKTHTGEITIEVKEFSLLAKSIRILPEKFHGLKDAEIRYRRRYIDLISNPSVKKIFILRSKIISSIRNYLESLNFLEVETPMLQPIPGGATAKPFITFHNALDQNLYLRIAPELYLKRLVVGGFERVFEINRNFRNEGISTVHNPEFTMMELYQAYANYKDMMELTQNLIIDVAKNVSGTLNLEVEGRSINLTPPWSSISFKEAFKKYANIEVRDLKSLDYAKKKIEEFKINFNKPFTFGNIVNEIFDKVIEDNFINPTFVYDYPVEISPLAKKKRGEDGIVERFELFINGLEIANAFSELNDPFDQEERFKEQLKAKNEGEEETHEMDEDYIMALEYGLPPTGGLGIGIDRLIMIFAGVSSIREVILFPQLRTKKEKLPEENEG